MTDDIRFNDLLNVGCGRRYHPNWTNVDLVPCGVGVKQCDVQRGLPFSDGSFDAVYHAHLLEHLTPEAAENMLRECFRVLRPGGVLRVVVPDLEGIAKAYLGTLMAADGGDEYARANHRWMTLEMIDQLARQNGGGRMGHAMNDPELINRDFIRGRVGQGSHPADDERKPWSRRLRNLFDDARKKLTSVAVLLLDGPEGRNAYREGRFRRSGEIHRWMYDRVSLSDLMLATGFEQTTACRAHESRIPDFDVYQLDRVGNRCQKPDSLYMESIKPAAAVAAPASSKSAA